MEIWELEFEWLKIRHFVKDCLKKTELPDLNVVLFLVGIQELGKPVHTKFTKEEKQDLMHIATCRLLSEEGYYNYLGLDHDGWPHYELIKPFTLSGVKEQEIFLKRVIVNYFNKYYIENSKIHIHE